MPKGLKSSVLLAVSLSHVSKTRRPIGPLRSARHPGVHSFGRKEIVTLARAFPRIVMGSSTIVGMGAASPIVGKSREWTYVVRVCDGNAGEIGPNIREMSLPISNVLAAVPPVAKKAIVRDQCNQRDFT